MADGTQQELPIVARPAGRVPTNPSIKSAWADPISSTHWRPATVRAALDDLESGRVYSGATLADAVGRDCVVAGAEAARVRALSSRSALPFSVLPGTGDGRRREAIRRRVEELWWTTCREDQIEPILRDTVKLGCAVGRISWIGSSTEWVPVLSHLAPHGLEWHEWSNRWTYTTRDGLRLDVTPGDGTWFLHLPHGPRSFMHGALRAIAEPWLQRRYAARDEARWCERHGLAVLAVKEPFSATDDVEGTDGTQADAVYSGIRSGMTSGAVIRLPQPQSKDEAGWDATWLELRGTSLDSMQKSLARCARDIETRLLGRSQDGGAKGGDGELMSETHRNEYLSSDAEALSTSLREQVWKPFTHYNYGGDLEVTPWGRYETRPTASLAGRAKVLVELGTAMTTLRAVGVDLEPIAEEFGLDLGEPPAPAPAPAPTDQPAPAEAP